MRRKGCSRYWERWRWTPRIWKALLWSGLGRVMGSKARAPGMRGATRFLTMVAGWWKRASKVWTGKPSSVRLERAFCCAAGVSRHPRATGAGIFVRARCRRPAAPMDCHAARSRPSQGCRPAGDQRPVAVRTPPGGRAWPGAGWRKQGRIEPLRPRNLRHGGPHGTISLPSTSQ